MENDLDLANDPEYQRLEAILKGRAFHQRRKIGPLFPTVYRMSKSEQYRSYHRYLRVILGWFLVCSSLWPAEFIPIVSHMVTLLPKGGHLPPWLILLIKFVCEYPPEEVQKIVATHEQNMEKGSFDDWTRTNAIFEAQQQDTEGNPELHKDWQMVRAVFPEMQGNEIGVNRRYLVSERGHRIGWKFDPNDRKSLFDTVLTALSYKWVLYGFQNDTPLVLKFSANAHAFGTMTVSPRNQHDDPVRNINWKTYGAIPKAYGVAYKGLKALKAKREREDEAIRTYTASLRAAELGLRGKERIEFIIKEAGLAENTDERKIRKYNRMAKRLLGVSTREE